MNYVYNRLKEIYNIIKLKFSRIECVWCFYYILSLLFLLKDFILFIYKKCKTLNIDKIKNPLKAVLLYTGSGFFYGIVFILLGSKNKKTLESAGICILIGFIFGIVVALIIYIKERNSEF
jgi:hypothetical protein